MKELRFRLASYWSVRGFAGLDGIGLTPEQMREIQRRIDVQVAAMNKHPVGWPCKPLKNRSRVVGYMKEKLIDNGFRPNMRFSNPSPRQIAFRGIQDGVEYLGVVVKSGPRQITVGLQAPSIRWSRRYTYRVPFES